MGVKADALKELDAMIKKFGLADSTVGRLITKDPNFMRRMRDPEKSISTKTLDKIWSFIRNKRRQKV